MKKCVGKPGFRKCIPQLTRHDCMRYQELWNMYVTSQKNFRKRKLAGAVGTGEKIGKNLKQNSKENLNKKRNEN
jgi:hypothetical protein